LGKIVNGEMIVNSCGEMITKWVYKLEDKFNGIKILPYVVMPNHFHAIIETDAWDDHTEVAHTWQGDHMGSPLHAIVGWFKTMTTNEYFRGIKTFGWKPVDKALWQRNYYEHIIRNEQSYEKIAEYIRCNPERWQMDKLYIKE